MRCGVGLGTDKPHLQVRKTEAQQAGHSFRVPQLGGNRARAHPQVLRENLTHGSIIHSPLPTFWQACWMRKGQTHLRGNGSPSLVVPNTVWWGSVLTLERPGGCECLEAVNP